MRFCYMYGLGLYNTILYFTWFWLKFHVGWRMMSVSNVFHWFEVDFSKHFGNYTFKDQHLLGGNHIKDFFLTKQSYIKGTNQMTILELFWWNLLTDFWPVVNQTCLSNTLFRLNHLNNLFLSTSLASRVFIWMVFWNRVWFGCYK